MLRNGVLFALNTACWEGAGQRYATLSFAISNKSASRSALMTSIRLAQTDLSKEYSRVNSITRMSSCYQCNTEFKIRHKHTANAPQKVHSIELQISVGECHVADI